MAYKAVLFDLDGTLLNTLEDISDSMNAALATLNCPPHAYAAYKIHVGDGMETLARRALPEGLRDEATVARCVLTMRKEYGLRWQKSRPYDGIRDMLDALKERGILLTVLSNKPDDFTKTIMSMMFSEFKWAHVAGARDDIPKKPDPAGALAIAKLVFVAPADFLYLGDTNTDMWTANAAGMFALGALWGFRPADELLASGAKALLNEPAELLKFI